MIELDETFNCLALSSAKSLQHRCSLKAVAIPVKEVQPILDSSPKPMYQDRPLSYPNQDSIQYLQRACEAF